MNEKCKTLIVTETPILEIDDKFFPSPFEAEKYLVQVRGMRVGNAQEKVRELINNALNKPRDESRRSFIQQAMSTASSMVLPSPSKVIIQGLLGVVETNWAKNLWGSWTAEEKHSVRCSFVRPLFSQQVVDQWFETEVHPIKFFLASSCIDLVKLDQAIQLGMVAHKRSYYPEDEWIFMSLVKESTFGRLPYTRLSGESLQQKGTEFTNTVRTSPLLNSLLFETFGESLYPLAQVFGVFQKSIGIQFTPTDPVLCQNLITQTVVHLERFETLFPGISGENLDEKKEEKIQHREVLMKARGGGECQGHLNALIEQCDEDTAQLDTNIQSLKKLWKEIGMQHGSSYDFVTIKNAYCALQKLITIFPIKSGIDR